MNDADREAKAREVFAQAFERAGDQHAADCIREAPAKAAARKAYALPLHYDVTITAMLAFADATRPQVSEHRCPNCRVRFSEVRDVDSHIAALRPQPSQAIPDAQAEIARLREAAINAALCLSGFAGEGITIRGFADPADIYVNLTAALGMPDADDDDLAAALAAPHPIARADDGEGERG